MLPKNLAPFLWSSDLKKINLEKDKKRVITNILNLGSKKATDWLFKQYDKKTIKQVIQKPLPGEWNKKSLNLWQIVFGIKKTKTASRKIRNL